MARNYKKDVKSVLRQYDRECKELCYTAFMPNEVERLKKDIAAEIESIDKMEAKKAQAMRTLRKMFDPVKFNAALYSPYAKNGEPQ